MQRLMFRIRNVAMLLRHLQWREILHKSGNRIYSNTYYYGLVHHLSQPQNITEATIPTTVRVMRDGDADILFNIHSPHLSRSGVSERLYRLLLINAGIQTCYVAVTKDGHPCSALWLIDSTENKRLNNISNGTFPLLAHDEMFLEGLFTSETYRNMHIMAASIGQVLSIARELGVKKIITFVHHENIQSLRSLSRSGFGKYMVKREQWFLFFRILTFEELSVPLENSNGYNQISDMDNLKVIFPEKRTGTHHSPSILFSHEKNDIAL